jgi:hypothetical protein
MSYQQERSTMSTQTSPTPASTQPARVRFRALWWVGPLAIVASVVANLLVRALALAIFDISPAFDPLSTPGNTIVLTAVGVLLAVLVFALVGRFSKQPVRTYLIIAVVALLISFVPDIALLVNAEGAPFEGIDVVSIGVLIVMHIVAAVVSVGLLITLAVEK